MRIALAGKGGVGKTTSAATLARLVARGGARVVAVDADSNPNLAAALGVDTGAGSLALPVSLVSRRLEGPALTAAVEQVLATHAAPGPDGVQLLRMGAPGHAEEGCLCSAHAVVSALLADLGDLPQIVTVLDLEASPEHMSRGTARHADLMLLVTEPYFRSLETVRRLADLAAELPIPQIAVLVNKVRTPGEAEAVAEFCQRRELAVIGMVPWDEQAVAADVAGVPVLDAAPDGPMVAALAALASQLLVPSPGS
jgi:CO dehydrogenase maturation factor